MRKKAQVPFDFLEPARFLHRDNRFRVQVRVRNRVALAHLPNSGRLGELLVPGRKIWVAPVPPSRRSSRRTDYDLVLVEFSGTLVSVDARLPEKVVARALKLGQIEVFQDYDRWQQQVQRGASRLDFCLESASPSPRCWIEVKSVTLVEENTARFPDAPTSRGQRHLRELIDAVKEGERAAVVFVVQREDVARFAPHAEADPVFTQTLRRAAKLGVEVYAWRCQVDLAGIQFLDSVPVVLAE